MDQPEIKLVINKQIQAPVEKVFAAWTNPEMLKQWFPPGENMTMPNVETDVRVGGNYMIHMHDPDSDADHIVSGQYEEVVPNHKLVFNWKWKDGVDRTQVTIELTDQGDDGTMLTLTHRGFSQQEFADKHNQGWGGCLNNLVKYFA